MQAMSGTATAISFESNDATKHPTAANARSGANFDGWKSFAKAWKPSIMKNQPSTAGRAAGHRTLSH